MAGVGTGVAALSVANFTTSAAEAKAGASSIIRPPEGKRILLSCKLGMIAKEVEKKKLSLVERLKMATEAGFDGVDFDEAGSFSAEEARAAVQESRVFVHNAINHAHWNQRLTSEKEEDRNKGRENLAHCLRVSHAAGGSGVLLVVATTHACIRC